MRVRIFLKGARLNDHSNLVKKVFSLFGNGLYRLPTSRQQSIAEDGIGRRMGAMNIGG